MKLLLSVLRLQYGASGSALCHVFDTAGGTIGRSSLCDWTIPDQSKTLSALHALISHNGRGFSITDTSTNGVFLNNIEAPLGRNQTAILKDGDTLYLAGFVIAVTVLGAGTHIQATRPALAPPHAVPTIPDPDWHRLDGPEGRGIPAPPLLPPPPAPSSEAGTAFGPAEAAAVGDESQAFWSALGLDRSRVPPAARERMMSGLGIAVRDAARSIAAVLPREPGDAELPADLAGYLDRTIASAVIDDATQRGVEKRSVTA